MGKEGEDESLPTAEVVVDLAQRYAGAVGHAACGQVGMAIGEQAFVCGLDELAAGLARHRHLHPSEPLVGRSTEC